MTSWCTLTHWGRVTHICVSDLTSIGSDNGLSPGRRQAIIKNNAGILLIRPLGTNFSEFFVEILIFSFKKMRLKVSSAKRRPFCLGLNELSFLVLGIDYSERTSSKLLQSIPWLLVSAPYHDDVIKWKRFLRYWPFVGGNSTNSPHKDQWRGALIISLICALTYGWVNHRNTDYLRRHRAHYDVTMMTHDIECVASTGSCLWLGRISLTWVNAFW